MVNTYTISPQICMNLVGVNSECKSVGLQLCSRVFLSGFSLYAKIYFLVRCLRVHINLGGGWDPLTYEFFSKIKSFLRNKHTKMCVFEDEEILGLGPPGTTHTFFFSGASATSTPQLRPHRV